jgi:hypothetical protein
MKTVIEMAREAGLLEPDDTEEEIRECGLEVWLFGERGIKAFEHFAELVRADEREACAKVADRYIGADPIADAIRARSNT